MYHNLGLWKMKVVAIFCFIFVFFFFKLSQLLNSLSLIPLPLAFIKKPQSQHGQGDSKQQTQNSFFKLKDTQQQVREVLFMSTVSLW